MHRFVWDLAYDGPVSPVTGRPAGRGPMAVPGTYRVRLTVGDEAQSSDLAVRIDPRVASGGVTVEHLAEQFDLNVQLRDAISQARAALARVRSALESAPQDEGERRAQLAEIRTALETASDLRYPQPMLIDQLEYLYGMTSRADQRPGRDAHRRYEQLRRELDALLRRLAPLVESGS
jgi:hypothetical protein